VVDTGGRGYPQGDVLIADRGHLPFRLSFPQRESSSGEAYGIKDSPDSEPPRHRPLPHEVPFTGTACSPEVGEWSEGPSLQKAAITTAGSRACDEAFRCTPGGAPTRVFMLAFVTRHYRGGRSVELAGATLDRAMTTTMG
jgi:hypothetical protein